MTITQLKYVITIAESSSITEAAQKLYMTQPSLSAAVRELEREYGIEIFNRTSRGISLTNDGSEFLAYARQIVDQSRLLEQRYSKKKPSRQLCSISTQHYAFAVGAFVDLITELDADQYEFTLRETRTYEIIDDVSSFRSELGILYLSDFNSKVITKLLRDRYLGFTPLFKALPHVFISRNHPLAGRDKLSLDDLADYPFLTYEQGANNSFYFAEEVLSTHEYKKAVHVSDRATLFNLLIGLNGYTICSGVLNSNLNGDNIVSKKLEIDDSMTVGYISSQKSKLSQIALAYIDKLKSLIEKYGFEVL